MFNVFEIASEVLWGPFTLFIIILFGSYLLIKSRGRYIYNAPIAVVKSFRNTGSSISPFMSLSTALAATMGTGNIVGVAWAIAMGGPGALFWMQIAAVAVMMIKFSETALAVRYSNLAAGPMGYLQNIKVIGRPIAIIFAVSCILASLGSGCITQSNSAAQALSQLNVPHVGCALLFGVVSWLAVDGGIKGVMKLMSFSVPVITVGYIIISIAVILKLRAELPETFKTILENALCFKALTGGTCGFVARKAIRYGFSKGIFSNEAGMGSSAISYSLVKNADEKQQGMLAVFEVFADTIICCSLTGVVLILTGCYSNENGAVAAISAFSVGLGAVYGYAAAIFIALFGLAAICGWYTYGANALEFLVPHSKSAQKLFKALYAFFSAAGAVMSVTDVWAASDFFTGIMMIVNIFGMIILLDRIKEIITV